MKKSSILAIDLGKNSFQVCGTTETGVVLFNRSFTANKLEKFLAGHPSCLVAMEACGTSHLWGRRALACGHEVRMIPPIYVKPFVKRSKNDANDAAAIATAVRQPDMRFVAVKTGEQQAQAMAFKSHQTFKRQRNQLLVTLRAHLREHGITLPTGARHMFYFERRLIEEDDLVPDLVREIAFIYYAQIHKLSEVTVLLEKQMGQAVRQDEDCCRLLEIPGYGPLNAAALLALAPPLETFKTGRDFAAWLGLVPRQHSTGGKTKLGRMSKMGQSDLRRLLILGATSCIRSASLKKLQPDSWLERLLARKARKLAAIAVANKMARIVWALTTKKTSYNGGLIKIA